MSKVSILIIDDDAESQAALWQILTSEDWQTGVTPGGAKALQELATGNWMLIVANAATTGVSGALYATLRELSFAPALESGKMRARVLFVVPESDALQLQPVLERERLPYVLKPFHFNDFMEKVGDLLMETESISQPIRRVRQSRADGMLGSHGGGQSGSGAAQARNTGMFAARTDYPMTEEEINEYERQQAEEETRKKKKKPTHLG
jgi:DNA-binding NtrC family response regulator